MAALTDDRDTKEMQSPFTMIHQVAEGADSTQFYAGGIACIDQSDGKVKKGAVSTTLVAIGRSEQNMLTGVSNTERPRIKSGIFKWANSAAADTIANDDIGKVCYIVDDQTVGLTDGTGTRSAMGLVVRVDADGVWVCTGFPLPLT